MKKTLTVVSRMNRVFEVDISNEACEKFKSGNHSFRHGDRIIVNATNRIGTIIGVAPSKWNNNKTLWFTLDGDNNRVSCSEPWEDGDLNLLLE